MGAAATLHAAELQSSARTSTATAATTATATACEKAAPGSAMMHYISLASSSERPWALLPRWPHGGGTLSQSQRPREHTGPHDQTR